MLCYVIYYVLYLQILRFYLGQQISQIVTMQSTNKPNTKVNYHSDCTMIKLICRWNLCPLNVQVKLNLLLTDQKVITSTCVYTQLRYLVFRHLTRLCACCEEAQILEHVNGEPGYLFEAIWFTNLTKKENHS